jgi:hypothetical protein
MGTEISFNSFLAIIILDEIVLQLEITICDLKFLVRKGSIGVFV